MASPRGTPSLRALVQGTFDPAHTRNRVLLRLLELAGSDVTVQRVALWDADRFSAVREGRLRLLGRAVHAYARLVGRAVRGARPDVVVVLYPGHLDMLVLAPIWHLRRVPVVFDPLLALHDTLVEDRALVRPTSFASRAARVVDRLALRLADLVIADSPEVADHYARAYRVDPDRVVVIQPSTDVDALGPPADGPGRPDRVFFHGSFIALHGIDTIVRAAAAAGTDLEFVIVGRGQESERIGALITELGGVPNLRVVEPVPFAQLGAEIRQATVCLGIFGRSAKAARVVPFKVFEYLAMGRPVVTGDTPAVRRALGDDVVRVPVGDPDALLRAVRALIADPDRRTELARRGRARFVAEFAPEVQARRLHDALAGVVGTRSRVG